MNVAIMVLGYVANHGDLIPLKPEDQLFVVGALNIALRYVTTRPVSLLPVGEPAKGSVDPTKLGKL